MALSKALQKFVEHAKKTDSYWVERAKLDFSVVLERQRKAAGLSYSEIAKKIATSAAYITKVFRGDSNLTIESMVKLAKATGGHLKIDIVDTAASSRSWDKKLRLVHGVSMNQITGTSVVTPQTVYRPAANEACLEAA